MSYSIRSPHSALGRMRRTSGARKPSGTASALYGIKSRRKRTYFVSPYAYRAESA